MDITSANPKSTISEFEPIGGWVSLLPAVGCVLSVGLVVGCHSPNSAQPPSAMAQADLQTGVSIYEDAIETIAISNDRDAVRLAQRTLHDGGLTAIESLRKHLTDRRVPVSNYVTRAVQGMPAMGAHCFWIIQDMIEPPVPKLYASRYSTLAPDNISKWLDSRAGKSLLELRIEAAAQSLESAKIDFDKTGKPHAKKAIEIYRERLEKYKAQAAT